MGLGGLRRLADPTQSAYLGAMVALGLGCATTKQVEPGRTAKTESTTPMLGLENAGDDQITLFGEFPEAMPKPFQAAAAIGLEQHTFTAEGGDFDVAIAPGGEWFLFSSTRHSRRPDLYIKTVGGLAVTQLTTDPAGDVQPAVSPTDGRVAFASNRSGNWDIWIIGTDGQRPMRLTRSRAHEVHPSFSPDGKKVVYCLLNPKSGQWELWVLEVNEPGRRRMIGYGLFPVWSPTSDTIVYQRARERGSRWFSIWTLTLVDGEPGFPTEIVAWEDAALILPSWSPDGKRIVFGTARESEKGAPVGSGKAPSGRIWVVDGDGSAPMKLSEGTGAEFAPAWSPDGRVFFVSTRSGSENIWSVRPVMPGTTATAGPAGEPRGGGAMPAAVVPTAATYRDASSGKPREGTLKQPS